MDVSVLSVSVVSVCVVIGLCGVVFVVVFKSIKGPIEILTPL